MNLTQALVVGECWGESLFSVPLFARERHMVTKERINQED